MEPGIFNIPMLFNGKFTPRALLYVERAKISALHLESAVPVREIFYEITKKRASNLIYV